MLYGNHIYHDKPVDQAAVVALRSNADATIEMLGKPTAQVDVFINRARATGGLESGWECEIG